MKCLLTNSVTKSMDIESCNSSLPSSVISLALLLIFDKDSNVNVRDHLGGDSDEKRPASSKDIDEEE